MKFELKIVHSDPRRFATVLRELADDFDKGSIPTNCTGNSVNGVDFDYHLLETDDLWEHDPDTKVVEFPRLSRLLANPCTKRVPTNDQTKGWIGVIQRMD